MKQEQLEQRCARRKQARNVGGKQESDVCIIIRMEKNMCVDLKREKQPKHDVQKLEKLLGCDGFGYQRGCVKMTVA